MIRRQEGFVGLLILAGVLLLSGGALVVNELADNPKHPDGKKKVISGCKGNCPTTPIPEPSSWALMIAGGAVVIYYIAKNKKD